MTRILIATLVAALTAAACSKGQQPATSLSPIAAPSATNPAEPDTSDAALQAIFDAYRADHVRLSTQEVWTKVPEAAPPYNEVYEQCLMSLGASGATRGKPIAGPFCDVAAQQISHQPRPDWNGERARYYGCFLLHILHGTRGPIALICGGPDARFPPD